MPSFCITEAEIDRTVDVAVEGIERAMA